MIKSMTGYGRESVQTEAGNITVEAKSVNHRFCDISIRLPQKLSAFENEIKKEVSRYTKRGRIDISVNIDDSRGSKRTFKIDRELAASYMNALEDLKDASNLKTPLTIADLIQVKGIISEDEKAIDEEALKKNVLECTAKSLKKLEEMRIEEGKNLASDINIHLKNISSKVDMLSKMQDKALDYHKGKIAERISKLSGGLELDESRLIQEIAILADKSDISEEITRLKSHIEQFCTIVEKGGELGRTLDFLVQEMNRETNTVGSKSCDSEISASVVSIKAILEKIKEQVQNIE